MRERAKNFWGSSEGKNSVCVMVWLLEYVLLAWFVTFLPQKIIEMTIFIGYVLALFSIYYWVVYRRNMEFCLYSLIILEVVLNGLDQPQRYESIIKLPFWSAYIILLFYFLVRVFLMQHIYVLLRDICLGFMDSVRERTEQKAREVLEKQANLKEIQDKRAEYIKNRSLIRRDFWSSVRNGIIETFYSVIDLGVAISQGLFGRRKADKVSKEKGERNTSARENMETAESVQQPTGKDNPYEIVLESEAENIERKIDKTTREIDPNDKQVNGETVSSKVTSSDKDRQSTDDRTPWWFYASMFVVFSIFIALFVLLLCYQFGNFSVGENDVEGVYNFGFLKKVVQNLQQVSGPSAVTANLIGIVLIDTVVLIFLLILAFIVFIVVIQILKSGVKMVKGLRETLKGNANPDYSSTVFYGIIVLSISYLVFRLYPFSVDSFNELLVRGDIFIYPIMLAILIPIITMIMDVINDHFIQGFLKEKRTKEVKKIFSDIAIGTLVAILTYIKFVTKDFLISIQELSTEEFDSKSTEDEEEQDAENSDNNSGNLDCNKLDMGDVETGGTEE